MPKSIIRVAAGAAAIFVITVAGGPGAAVTSADPGSSRSPSGQSRDGANSRGHGNGPQVQRGSRDGERRSNDRNVNGRRGEDLSSRGEPDVTAGDGPSTFVVAQSTTTSSRGVVAASEAPTVAASEAPAVVAEVPTVPVASAGTGGGGSAPGASVAPLVVPRVIFGDGRSRGLLSPAEPATAQRAEPAPATSVEPTAAAPASPTPLVMDVSPWPLSETPVITFFGKVESGWPVGVLFGIAGLLLAPIAGVWLGHRQARAAKVTSNLAILEDPTPTPTPTQAGAGFGS
ncbi:MAG: hypothetical protein QOD90_1236 [Mycobacterium sp.]|nr:hypothetical protein [Mycobacterium sp.]